MASCSYDDFDEEDIDDDILQDCGLPTAAERAAAIAAAAAAASAPSADAATWNVVEFSADPVLLDEDRRTLFAGVEAQWHAYHTRNGEVLSHIQRLLNASGDAYLSAAFMMANSYDFHRSRPDSLASYVMERFELWLEEHRRLNGALPTLRPRTALEAVSAVAKQQNNKLVQRVVRIYRGVDDKLAFVGLVRWLVESKNFSGACRLALALQLFDAFGIEDFVVPLLLQDKLSLALDFLTGSATLQVDTVLFLDDYVNAPHRLLDLALDRRIPDIHHGRLNSKNMTKLVKSLVQRFHLDMELCPQTSTRQSASGLRYLIHRKYDDNAIEEANWEEMVRLAVADSPALHLELVELLYKVSDAEAAATWAVRYAVPIERLPSGLAQLVVQYGNQSPQRSTELRSHASAAEFHELKLPSSRVHWIATWPDLQEAMNCIAQYGVVGVDVEWRANFVGVQPVRAALIQLACRDVVFLVDIVALRDVDGAGGQRAAQALVEYVFGNGRLLKLGYGMREDLQVVARSLPGLEQLAQVVCRFLDLSVVMPNIQSVHPTFVRAHREHGAARSAKGLSELVRHCLGRPLDKREQFSDWERRPLRPTQLAYAALDAYCLVEVYDFVQHRAAELGLDFNELLTHSPADTNEAKPSKSKRRQGRGRGRRPPAEEPATPQADRQADGASDGSHWS